MKKSIFKIIATTISTIVLSFSFLYPAIAVGGSNDNSYVECRYLLGMPSWDCNTGLTSGQSINADQLTRGIWTAVFNVLTDISVIAAYLALGYVIYGGYLYMFSSGEASKVATGKKTLTQAFIGFVIIMSASVILNAIRIALGANFAANCTEAGQCYNYDNASDMVDTLVNWIIAISGIVAVSFIVIGAISYTTSAGEPSKLEKAKKTILYAVIGLAIVGLAKIITSFAFSVVKQANENNSYTNIIMIKELNE